jgi:hypothetical protein
MILCGRYGNFQILALLTLFHGAYVDTATKLAPIIRRLELSSPLYSVPSDNGSHPPFHVRRRYQRCKRVAWRYAVRAEHDWVLELDYRLVEGCSIIFTPPL